MLTLTFVVLFLSVPIVAHRLLRVAGVRLSAFSIPSLLFLSILVSSYAGMMPLYFEWFDYGVDRGVRDQALVLSLFLTSASALIFFALGNVFARKAMGIGPARGIGVVARGLGQKELLVIVVALLGCLIVLQRYLSEVPAVALLVSQAGDAADVSLARSAMTNDFGGRYHWYSVIMHDVASMLLFTTFAHWLLVRSGAALLLFGATFLLAGFAAVMGAEKSLFVWLLVGLYLTNVVLRHNSQYFKGRWLLLLVLAGGFVVALFSTFMGVADGIRALSMTAGRVFMGQIVPAYWYFEYFPAQHEFLLGRSLPNPGGLLPFEPFALTIEVSKLQSSGNSAVVGSAPTVFWGELYANFGIVAAAIIGPFFVGLVLNTISRAIDIVGDSTLKVGLVVWLALHFRTLAETGLGAFLFDVYLAVVLAVFFTLYVLAHRGRLGIHRFRDDPRLNGPLEETQ